MPFHCSNDFEQFRSPGFLRQFPADPGDQADHDRDAGQFDIFIRPVGIGTHQTQSVNGGHACRCCEIAVGTPPGGDGFHVNAQFFCLLNDPGLEDQALFGGRMGGRSIAPVIRIWAFWNCRFSGRPAKKFGHPLFFFRVQNPDIYGGGGPGRG